MIKQVTLIFPHQLFENISNLDTATPIYLIEEFLFFKQFKFHKQKIAFHRASLKFYEAYLVSKNFKVHYVDSTSPLSDIRKLINELNDNAIKQIIYIDVTDYWLYKRINETAIKHNIALTEFSSSLFLNTKQELSTFFHSKKMNFHQTTFYVQERKKRKILLEENAKPLGGKWTFDTENRKKISFKKNSPFHKLPEAHSLS